MLEQDQHQHQHQHWQLEAHRMFSAEIMAAMPSLEQLTALQAGSV